MMKFETLRWSMICLIFSLALGAVYITGTAGSRVRINQTDEMLVRLDSAMQQLREINIRQDMIIDEMRNRTVDRYYRADAIEWQEHHMREHHGGDDHEETKLDP